MQIYTSKSLEGLDFKTKYRLKDYTDNKEKLYIFGMYRDEDFETLKNHNGEVTIVWQGMDAKYIPVRWLKKIREVENISISHWINRSLNDLNIPNKLKYLSATKEDSFNNEPNGDCIYFYTSDNSETSKLYYGENYLEEIKRITGLKIIRATYKSYDKEELKKIYKECFINIRLTKYDGCPNGVLEMGLMGRKSIFNGDLPHCIKWNNINGICKNIIIEYNNRNNNNKYISETFKKFINENRM